MDFEKSMSGDVKTAPGNELRQPYSCPALRALGDVRELTLGASPLNVNDSCDNNVDGHKACF